jgi:hypothetical protein
MADESESADKIAMGNNSIQLLTRVVAGALVAVSALFGWPFIVAAALATMALYSYQQHRNKIEDEKKLLDLYRRDVAALQNKAPEDVTLADLRELAKPVEKGGRGIKTFQTALQYDTHQQILHIASEAISSIIIGGGLVALITTGALTIPAHLAIMHIPFGALIGGAFALGHRFIDSIIDTIWGKEDWEKGINYGIKKLADQVVNKPLKPAQVFELIAEANPQLRRTIKASYGETFDKLSLTQRQKIVRDAEPELRVEALTEAINNGIIKPSFIGFVAYGQARDSAQDYARYETLFTQPIANSDITHGMEEERRNIHVKRFLAETGQVSGARHIH